MSSVEEELRHALDERKVNHSFRSLRCPLPQRSALVDFCSNDYLGFARSEILREKIKEFESKCHDVLIGSTGSRLISGNTRFYEELEDRISKFHHADAGLIFNSGYDANLGFFSCIPQRTDTILYDQLVHASIRDGIRLSFARGFSFEHNNVDALERRLKGATGNIFVAVESVYSMDGDCSPLTEIVELCSHYSANLIVDEAHATGVFGNRGEGKVVELGLEKRIFARLYTFGKALGCHGAIVLGSETLRTYLVNFARSFIFTTALPFHSLISISCAYDQLGLSNKERSDLKSRISYFKGKIGPDIRHRMIESNSAIQCVVIRGNEKVRSAARNLQEDGFDVRPILHPTVPKGSERLRICLHAFNTEDEIDGLMRAMSGELLNAQVGDGVPFMRSQKS